MPCEWLVGLCQYTVNVMVPVGANKLVLKDRMERDDRGIQKICVIWYSFCILGKSSARPFEVKQLPFTRSSS